ncbi:hypothetical protein O6H91_03G034900 [Diphasiastrum complanatum]|uniref:Uncharacterized protein n=1 Tax=Diphasiastrum complanatum TaxID=34168 RepID=A0ACC2E592_DIPCM|nr:hypothetical protein O6H91_03G034900 [Diphasiastrum complanatum]
MSWGAYVPLAEEMPSQVVVVSAHSKTVEDEYEVESVLLEAMVAGHSLSLMDQQGGVEGIALKLRSSIDTGIRGDKADLQRRRCLFGSNTYTEKPVKGFWSFLWDAMHDLMLIILAACAFMSLAVGVSTEGWEEGCYDGAGIGFSIIIVVFVTAISDYQQSLQFRALDKEKKKIYIHVIRESQRRKVCINDLVVGDVVYLSTGDQVAADGVFISGHSLIIDESSMTGESEPQHINEQKPFLLSGTKVQDGFGLMLVTGVGMNTEWGHSMAVLGKEGDDETPLQQKLSRLALLIGLPLAVTLTLAYAMRRMMVQKALVRKLSACETMGSATYICCDKTGTLTTNQMTVVKSWIEGAIWQSNGTTPLVSFMVKQLLLESIFVNTAGDVSEGKNGELAFFGTPTETALLKFGVALGEFKSTRPKTNIIKLEPFNSVKKKMGVLVRSSSGGNLRAHWKGASEIVLGCCASAIDAAGSIVPLDDSKYSELMGVIKRFSDDSLRTLCLAFKDLPSNYVSEGPIPDKALVCVAIVGIKDPIRPGVKDAVQVCYAAGIRVLMLTGDNLNTAASIARECGILTDGDVVEGPEFRKLSSEELRRRIPRLQVMARSSPSDKHRLVMELQAMEEVVAVTGDGTNDAPALHEADVGLAMGIAGTEVAKESADIVILDDNFATIVNVAKFGRSVYINIQKFVQFQLTVNLAALVLNFVAACITGHAPLSTIQLLWINLIMDTLAALALATEPPNDDLMKLPPLGRKGNFITKYMWRNIYAQVFYQLTVLAILHYRGKDILQLKGPKYMEVLDTMIFNSFVFCQVFNEFNAREMKKLNVFRHTFNNWIFVMIVGITITVQFVLVQFLGKIANTAALDLQQWAITVLIGFFSLVVDMAAKLINRIYARLFDPKRDSLIITSFLHHIPTGAYQQV